MEAYLGAFTGSFHLHNTRSIWKRRVPCRHAVSSSGYTSPELSRKGWLPLFYTLHINPQVMWSSHPCRAASPAREDWQQASGVVLQEFGQEHLSHPCRALSDDSAGFHHFMVILHLNQYLLQCSELEFNLWGDFFTFPCVLCCWYSLVCEPAQEGHRNNHNTMDEMERKFGFVETKPWVL